MMAKFDGSNDKYDYAKLAIVQNMMLIADKNDKSSNFKGTSVTQSMIWWQWLMEMTITIIANCFLILPLVMITVVRLKNVKLKYFS